MKLIAQYNRLDPDKIDLFYNSPKPMHFATVCAEDFAVDILEAIDDLSYTHLKLELDQ